MPHPVKIFIGSSTEGLSIAKKIGAFLTNSFNKQEFPAEVISWTRSFDLSSTYIESLEKSAENIDFAILVMTNDDITQSRKTKTDSPRDNVIFEAGLFMGSLGRSRTLIINSDNIKIPSDLFGLATKQFDVKDRNLNKYLQKFSMDMVSHIQEAGPRIRIDPKAYFELIHYSQKVEGTWWEKISGNDYISLSCFTIELDEYKYNIRLSGGRSFDQEGNFVAHWKSTLLGFDQEEQKIMYHWKGWHNRPNLSNVSFHGYGEFEFQHTIGQTAMYKGFGKFWEINESEPEKTKIKPIEIQKITDPAVINTLNTGSNEDIRTLVVNTINKW